MTILEPGSLVLGRYVVGPFLGAGGMAAVYQATDTRTGREAAVKVMLHAFEPSLVKRFEAEAMALSKVSHPNVVQLFAFGETPGGAPCMVMEKLEGIDLEKHIEASPNARLPELEAITIAIDVLEGLDAIHAAGIVHRDLKPSNVFLSDVGDSRRRAKLLDFGIAKASAAPKLTRTGNSVGTPAYMAPEQILGTPSSIGPRTDLYQVGMVLFEMLTGAMAFPCEQMTDLVLRCSQPPTRADVMGLAFAAQYDPLFVRILAARPEHRPPSALDLIASLEARRTGRSLPAWERGPSGGLPYEATSSLPTPAHEVAQPSGSLLSSTFHADDEPRAKVRIRGIAARLPASRLARTEERRWIAGQVPPGARSFRVGAEVMVILGTIDVVATQAIAVKLRGRFGSGVVVETAEMPESFTISIAQLSGAGGLPEGLAELVARVL